MDAFENTPCVTPVPCLSTIFSIFRFISQTVQQTLASQEQLRALAHIIAQLLLTLDREYRSGRLSVGHTSTARESLRRLLKEISAFIEKLASRPFLQSLLTKTERIAEIGGYHREVNSLVPAFKLSNLIDTNEWSSKMEEGLVKDQQLLHNQLGNLETDRQELFQLLDIHGSETALLVCLQRRLASQSDSDRERQFFHYILQLLTARNEFDVEVEDWMITSYEVEFGPRIGFGGFGEVYKGMWNKAPVAIKVLRTDSGLIPSPTAIRREVKTWSAMRHTHILQFLGANELDDRPFIVMPYLRNGNVRDYIRARPGCDRLPIIHHVCLGLVYLHSRSIIHGDLKGLNVLIDDGGNAVLCDFGLSHVKADTMSHTARSSTASSARGIVGSRNWMAPELLVGGALRKPCDIYALGMTIYEVFTNNVPLGNVVYADFIELVVKQDARPERPDDDEAPTLSDAIWEVTEKCWAKDPRKRPTASATCNLVSCLLGTNVAPTSSHPELAIHARHRQLASRMTLSVETMVGAVPTASTPHLPIHPAHLRLAPHATPSAEITVRAAPTSLTTEQLGVQDQLEQNKEESRKSMQSVEESMSLVAEKDTKMLEAAQAIIKAFDMVKEQVALRGLGDNKIVDGQSTHVDATIVANVFNSSAIDITVSSSVEISYDQARIGYAELMGLRLHPGNNVVPLRWKVQPRSDVDAKARDFINQYITTSKEIPILLHAKIANTTISDQQRPFHDLKAHSYIQGIGSCFVSRVYAHTGIGVGLLINKSVDFEFVFENPLDAPVTIHDFVVDASIRGTRIIHVEHVFNSFTVPGKGSKQTPLIPDAHLIQGLAKTLMLINASNYLDVAVNAATVSVGSFRLESLQFNLTNVPFSVSA